DATSNVGRSCAAIRTTPTSSHLPRDIDPPSATGCDSDYRGCASPGRLLAINPAIANQRSRGAVAAVMRGSGVYRVLSRPRGKPNDRRRQAVSQQAGGGRSPKNSTNSVSNRRVLEASYNIGANR